MKLVWDEPKRLANLVKHGMDFADLTPDFFETAHVTDARMSRLIAVGRISNRATTVIFSILGSEAQIDKRGLCSMSKAKIFKPGQGYSRDDWDAVDSPDMTAEELANAKPFAEVFPKLAASIRRGRGPARTPTKIPVSIRLSPEVVEHFKAKGPGWQTHIDDALRKIASRKR